MTDSPKLSVLVAVRNRPQKVRRAIASVPLERAGIEIVVVDDASTDETADVVESEFGERVRLIRLQQNVGAGGARNAGARAARGEWLLILDSDNELLPGAVEAIDEAIARWGDDCAVIQMGSVRADGRATGKKSFPDGVVDHRAILLRGLDGEYCAMVRRDALLETPYNEWAGRDNAGVTWMLIAREHGMAVTDRPVLRYDEGGEDRLSNRRRSLRDPREAAACHHQLLDIFGDELRRERPDLWGEHMALAAFFDMLWRGRRPVFLGLLNGLKASRRRTTLVAAALVLAGPRLSRKVYARHT